MKQGYLYINRDTGRYELLDDDFNYITYFTCGERLEVHFINDGWIKGRIEHMESMGGYYFLSDNDKKYYLYDGYAARVK